MRNRFRGLPGDVPGDVDELATRAIDCVGTVRRHVGAGLPERFYHRAVEIELARQGVPFASRPPVAVRYGNETLGHVFPDFVVAGRLVLELKAVDEVHPAHEAQLLTYLTASGLPLGLLINCNAIPFGSGIRRRVNSPAAWTA